MYTLDMIMFLLQSQKKSQKDLCDHLGLNAQAFTDWKSQKSESYMKYLPQIADYFGVSVDFLIEKEHEESHRARLVAWICTLSDDECKRVEALLHAANFLPDAF